MREKKKTQDQARPGIGKAAVRFLAFRVLGRRLGGSAGAFVWSGEWPGAAAWRDHGAEESGFLAVLLGSLSVDNDERYLAPT